MLFEFLSKLVTLIPVPLNAPRVLRFAEPDPPPPSESVPPSFDEIVPFLGSVRQENAVQTPRLTYWLDLRPTPNPTPSPRPKTIRAMTEHAHTQGTQSLPAGGRRSLAEDAARFPLLDIGKPYAKSSAASFSSAPATCFSDITVALFITTFSSSWRRTMASGSEEKPSLYADQIGSGLVEEF